LSYLYCLVIALSHVIADTSSELHGNLIIHTRLPRHPSPNDNSLNGWGRNRGRESPALFVQSLAGIAILYHFVDLIISWSTQYRDQTV